MIYTDEQMKERFGTHYTTSTQLENNKSVFQAVRVVKEQFGFESYWETYPTVEAAIEHMKEEAISRLENEEERLDGIMSRYHSLPWYKRAWSFVFKRGWKANSIVDKRLKEYSDQLDEDLEAIKNYKLELINPDTTYEFKYSDLKVGDKVYVVVTRQNVLDEGLHELTITNLEYFLRYENQVYFRGETEEGFRLEQYEDTISDGMAYHEVFTNRDEAVAFLKEDIQTKMQKLREMELSLDTNK